MTLTCPAVTILTLVMHFMTWLPKKQNKHNDLPYSTVNTSSAGIMSPTCKLGKYYKAIGPM